MKKLLLLSIWLFASAILHAQNPEILNSYRFVYLPQLMYDGGQTDIYGIRKTIMETLTASGVPLFLDEKEITRDAMKDPLSSFRNYKYKYVEAVKVNTEKSEASDDSIEWKSGKLLVWDDFKGTAPENAPADALTYTANETSFDAFSIGNQFNVESKI